MENVADPNLWSQYGPAGLFGLFALACIGLFLRYLTSQSKEWREHLKAERDQRKEVMTMANGSLLKLSDSIQQLDKTIDKLNGGKA